MLKFELKDSWDLASKALSIFQEMRNLEGIAESYFMLGIIASKTKKPDIFRPHPPQLSHF